MTRDDARREVRRLVDSDWTRTAFAEEAGLSYKTLDTFLDGKTWPHGPNLAKIERALGKPAGWIADLAEGVVTTDVPGALEEAIDRDPRLLPETRAHLRNQLELLLRIQGASPELLARQERRRDAAAQEEARERARLRALLAEEAARQNGAPDVAPPAPAPPAKPRRKGRS